MADGIVNSHVYPAGSMETTNGKTVSCAEAYYSVECEGYFNSDDVNRSVVYCIWSRGAVLRSVGPATDTA